MSRRVAADEPAPILLALDPSAPGADAERLALVLARAYDAPVVLATVYPLIGLRSYVHSRRYEHLLREEAERFLAGHADRWRAEGAGVPVATTCTGSPSAARGLHELARAAGARLAVVGPSHRHGAGRRVPGPMGSRFAHGAPCPVAVAAGRVPERLEHIGVAFATAGDGRAALEAAAALAGRTGAGLRVISVAGPLPWMDIVQPEFEDATLPELYAGHLAYEVEKAVEDLPPDVVAEIELPAGDAGELLAAASAELDLLVCGSRGHGPLGEVVLGSTSHALLGAARCPVLLVPRSERASGPQTRVSQSRSLSA